jgi:pyruvate dehydrogenase E1 component alpha subunit
MTAPAPKDPASGEAKPEAVAAPEPSGATTPETAGEVPAAAAGEAAPGASGEVAAAAALAGKSESDGPRDAKLAAEIAAQFKGQSKDDLLRDYLGMLRIRRFEEAAARAYTRGKISGFLHLYIGQEAIAVATKQATEPQDRIVSAYRTHGFALALGSDIKACAAELFGKAAGLVGGMGGSMHFFDKKHQLWGGYAIVGNHIPVAAGHAFASKYTGDGAVTLVFMGDGAVGIGPVHEGMTLAGIWKLPIVFVVENNQYSMGTPLKRTLPVEDITSRAAGYGFKSDRFHVTSVAETRERIAAAVKRAREDNQPTLLELITYRFRGHSMSDPAKYRQKEEVETWRLQDPLERTLRALQQLHGLDEAALEEHDRKIIAEVDAAYEFADSTPQPPPEARFENILVGE